MTKTPKSIISAYAPKNLPRPVRSHAGLDRAYDFLNQELFGGILPPCLITLERHGKAYGYFSRRRFVNVNDNKEIVDEIALNPIHFARQMTAKVLGTLTHEMVHAWQFHFGKASRGRYHNKQWASKMVEIGLVPSSTGVPGGKPTGERVSHYVRSGGPFDRAVTAYLDREAPVLFQDRAYFVVQRGEKPKAGEREDEDEAEDQDNERKDNEERDLERDSRERERKAASKTRYYCPTPECSIAWAKRGSEFICKKCDEQMLPGRRP